MKYLVCAGAILCASAFCGIGLMSKASEGGYAVSLPAVASR